MRNQLNAQATGKLTSGMGSHPIGNDQQISRTLPHFRIVGQDDRKTILVVGSAHSDITKGLGQSYRCPVSSSCIPSCTRVQI